MIDLEGRLSDLLARSAAAVEIRPDLDAVTHAPRVLTRRRSPYVLAVAAAAGVALLVAATQLLPADDPETTRTSGPPPAGTPPRYIVPGRPWNLVHHGENQQIYGNAGGRRLTLSWYSGDQWKRRVALWGLEESDKRRVGDRDWLVSETQQVALWRHGGYVFELHMNLWDPGLFMTVAEYEEVDEETWREDQPQDALTPSVQNRLIEETIDEYTVPESFTLDQLATAYEARGTRDTIRLEVANAVVCAWVDVWRDVPESKAIAVTHLLEWKEWPIPEAAETGEWGGDVLLLIEQMTNEQLYGDVEFDLYTFGCPED